MNDFNYYAPTKVVFGKGAEQKVGNLIKEQNCKKVLIHYGSGSARRSGLLDRIEAIFDKEGITYVELGGVVTNPRLSLVYEGIALCKKENVTTIRSAAGQSIMGKTSRPHDFRARIIIFRLFYKDFCISDHRAHLCFTDSIRQFHVFTVVEIAFHRMHQDIRASACCLIRWKRHRKLRI